MVKLKLNIEKFYYEQTFLWSVETFLP